VETSTAARVAPSISRIRPYALQHVAKDTSGRSMVVINQMDEFTKQRMALNEQNAEKASTEDEAEVTRQMNSEGEAVEASKEKAPADGEEEDELLEEEDEISVATPKLAEARTITIQPVNEYRLPKTKGHVKDEKRDKKTKKVEQTEDKDEEVMHEVFDPSLHTRRTIAVRVERLFSWFSLISIPVYVMR
jgi:hypothetical protein